jgi:hypothetical protein
VRIKARIREVGFIYDGSLVVRWTQCGKPNCRCREDPTKRHGPYYQLSWKEKGKTVSRRLSQEHGRLYQEWAENRRLLESIVEHMHAVSHKARRCLLAGLGKDFKKLESSRSRKRASTTPGYRTKPSITLD